MTGPQPSRDRKRAGCFKPREHPIPAVAAQFVHAFTIRNRDGETPPGFWLISN